MRNTWTISIKKTALALIVASSLSGLTTQTAHAATIDIATIKCSDLAKYDTEYIGFLLIWLDGYLGGRADDTTFDSDRMLKTADSAKKLCAENLEKGLVTIFKEAEGH